MKICELSHPKTYLLLVLEQNKKIKRLATFAGHATTLSIRSKSLNL